MNLSKQKTSGIFLQFCSLSIPLVLGNILQQFYNAIDTAVIGRFAGKEEFAAVGVASTVMNLFLFSLVGICSGISILFAQSYGASDEKAFRKYHFMGTVSGLLFTMLLSTLGIVFLPVILSWIQTPAEILPYTAAYLRIIFAGMVISYLYNLYAALLRSIGKANISLAALFLAVVVNLILDLFFVGRLGLGTTGAALATLIAQCISTLYCMLYLWKKASWVWFHKEDRSFSLPMLQNLVQLSFVTCIHQISIYLGKLLVQSSVNGAGTEIIAAYTGASRIEDFANSFGSSGATATSILVAQYFGAGKKEKVRETFRVSLLTLSLLGIASALIMALSAGITVPLLLNQTGGTSFEEACRYLRIISLFYLFCFTGNTYAGYFEGTGKAFYTFMGAAGHITLRVIMVHLLVPSLGLSAVAISCGTGWILVNLFWEILRRKDHASDNPVLQPLTASVAKAENDASYKPVTSHS